MFSQNCNLSLFRNTLYDGKLEDFISTRCITRPAWVQARLATFQDREQADLPRRLTVRNSDTVKYRGHQDFM